MSGDKGISLEELNQITEGFPRHNLIDTYSRVQRLEKLEKHLNGDNELYIKRDDLLRPLFGSKLRYIEFVLGHYIEEGADCLIHCGGLTSNYMIQLAMIGATENIDVHIILRGEPPEVFQGNLLLHKIFNTTLYFDSDLKYSNNHCKRKLQKELEGKGRRPFAIDYPFSNYYAYLGFIRAYVELVNQINEGDLPQIDEIYLCSNGPSYLGLKIATSLLAHDVKVVAFPPIRWEDTGLNHIAEDRAALAKKGVAEFSESVAHPVSVTDVTFDERYVGDGYGIPSAGAIEAIELLARKEGILLDPIYTGKAMSALLDYIERGQINNKRVLFWHTGGWGNLSYFNEYFR